MFEDDNRTLRRGIVMLRGINKTIAARREGGPWVLYTLGGNSTQGKAEGAISPHGCTNRHLA